MIPVYTIGVLHAKCLKDLPSHFVLSFVRWILKAENTATGRVNLIGIVFTGIIGLVKGELFTRTGLIIIGMFVISGIISDWTHNHRV